MEQWKTIKDFEDYEISTEGTVRSKKTNRILKPQMQPTGYYKVGLSKNGFYKSLFVHRLVALTYLDNTNNLPEVDHINSIRTDNRVENLKWVSKQENLRNRKTFCKKVIMLTKECKALHYFNNAIEAAEFLIKEAIIKPECKMSAQVAISQTINHKRPSAYGYKWLEDKEYFE